MKKTMLIAITVALSSMMFAGVNVTWGNTYYDGTSGIMSNSSFGVWFDVNDKTAVGWENGMKVSLAGTGDVFGADLANGSVRLGYDGGTSLGANYNWWSGGGSGWNTTLGTAVDFVLTTTTGAGAQTQGDVSFTINLGFGF
jgi:hypothetical protein